MKLVKTSQYARLSRLNLLAEANRIKQAVASVPKYASLADKLAALGGKIAVSAANQALRDEKETELKELILVTARDSKELVAMVQEIAVGCVGLSAEPMDLVAAGLEMQKSHEPVGALGKVLNVRVIASTDSGKVLVRWKRLKGASLYEISTTDNPNVGTWTLRSAETKCKGTLEELVSGQRVWVRVRAKGAAGFGYWSNPAMAMVS
ncbi:MAG: fibronectin type III domain-containing protein [Verrucomicrobiota bacterium]